MNNRIAMLAQPASSDSRNGHTSSDKEGDSRLAATPLRFLRFDAVRDRTGLSRTTIWRLERKGVFPRHRQISANAVAWREDEVEAWIESRTNKA